MHDTLTMYPAFQRDSASPPSSPTMGDYDVSSDGDGTPNPSPFPDGPLADNPDEGNRDDWIHCALAVVQSVQN